MNDGLSPEEKAWDGYYYTLSAIHEVGRVDGYPVLLLQEVGK